MLTYTRIKQYLRDHFMKNITLSLTLLFTLLACETKESDIIEDQSKIYGRYSVNIEKGSKRAKGKVVFFESSRQVFNDYVALRGDSFVEFENIRMQEVKPWLGDNVVYENNSTSSGHITATDTFDFYYRNNDGDEFVNTLSLPSFVKINKNSIKATYTENSTKIQFSWDYTETNINRDRTKVQAIINTKNSNASSTRNEPILTNPVTIIITKSEEDTFPGTLKSIKLCSFITEKADGLNRNNEKTSTFCDDKILFD